MRDLQDLISELQFSYRVGKTAEDARNRLFAGTCAFVRIYAAGWQAHDDPAERKSRAAIAQRVVKHTLRAARPLDEKGKPRLPLPEILSGLDPLQDGDDRIALVGGFLLDALPGPWWAFEEHRHRERQRAEHIAARLPGWDQLSGIAGFSAWGFAALIGELGDITDDSLPEERRTGGKVSGSRRLYKRLGLAPDSQYGQGDRRTGRKIPRARRGRIMGIIAEPLLRSQWRGGKDGQPGHPIGPYGAVYAAAKASRIERVLAGERGEAELKHYRRTGSNGWADKSARRAMVKALIHDVHRAWHGLPLTYTGAATDEDTGRDQLAAE